MVRNFSIQNTHGKIYFPGLTDLTDVDLERDIVIANHIEIYPDETITKPPIGRKLRKEFIATLNNVCKP